MKIITLLNEKGGVGKTTMAGHIGAGLAIRGQRVLLIDGDPQGHLTVQMGLQKWGGLYRLLIQEAKWKDVLARPKQEVWAGDYPAEGELALLPGNVETRAIPMMTDDANLLRERLSELARRFDVVVIDTSPTPSMLHSMIYVATDHMLYPSMCQFLSLDGLAESVRHIGKLNTTRQSYGLDAAQMAGVIPTMYRSNTNAHKYGLHLLFKTFPERVLPTINHSTIWQDREYKQKLLFAYAPEHESTYQLWSLIDRVQEVCYAG